MRRRRQRRPEYGGLLFAIGADVFKCRDLNPKPRTSLAFAHRGGAQSDRRHLRLTTRALQHRQFRGGGLRRRGAAMRTVLTANEHHGETGRARNRGEL